MRLITSRVRCLARMAEPFAVGLRTGAPVDAGAAIRIRAEELSRASTPVDPYEVVASLQQVDVGAAILISIALAVGPGPWLAPIGIGTNIRPTRQVALFLARTLRLEREQWAADAADGFSYSPPPLVAVAMAAIFALGGLVTERALLLLLDGSLTFVSSLSGSLVVAAAFFEIIRPQLTSREANDASEARFAEFESFATAQLEFAPGGSCHETDIVRGFRTFYPKYRPSSDKISDGDIEGMMRRWGWPRGRFERTPAGYYQGIRLRPSSLKTVF